MPVVTLVLPGLDYEGVLTLLVRKFRGTVRLSGERQAWKSLTVQLPEGQLKITCLTQDSNLEQFIHVKYGMANHFNSIEGVEPVHTKFLVTASLAAPLYLGVTADPEIVKDDPRQNVVLAIAEANHGMLYVGDAVYNGRGQLLLDVDGNVETIPDPEVMASFLKLKCWPVVYDADTDSQPPSFHINPKSMKLNVHHYLRGPGRRFLDEFGLPEGVAAFAWLASLLVALVQLVSIVWSPLGLKTLQTMFTPGAYTHPGNKIKEQPELLVPVILAGIIVGPRGHSLMLGSFDSETQADLRFLAEKAQELGELYVEGSSDPRNAEVIALLKNDAYRPYRRRPVPAINAEGRSLVMFDVEINNTFGHGEAYDKLFYLFAAATAEDGGCIVQVPWNLATAPPVRGAAAEAARQIRVVAPPTSHRRALIMAGVGAVLLLSIVGSWKWWHMPPRPQVFTPQPLREFRSWTYLRDENGRRGHFTNKGSYWEEWKEDKAWPEGKRLFGTFDLNSQTGEYLELVRRSEPPLYVRLSGTRGEWSWNRQRWTLIGLGGPD